MCVCAHALKAKKVYTIYQNILGLFYDERVGNRVHCVFLVTFWCGCL